ncbi:MAG: imidazole glycerol phosphate synthase subunit HisH [[Clostridium] leptum]
MIAVIDYGAGNLQSVIKALHYIGCDAVITKDKQVLQNADGAILPGVGSFADAMDCMKASGLTESVIGYANSGKPFLGICLGLQLLFEASEESPGAKGLGLLKGKITKIPAGEGLKIPHMGWNDLTIPSRTGLFAGITGNPYVYFVHSIDCRRSGHCFMRRAGVSIQPSVQGVFLPHNSIWKKRKRRFRCCVTSQPLPEGGTLNAC